MQWYVIVRTFYTVSVNNASLFWLCFSLFSCCHLHLQILRLVWVVVVVAKLIAVRHRRFGHRIDH